MRLTSLALGILIGTVLFTTASVIIAWTGPTAPPPGGNIAAPLNVGTTDQIKDAGLGLDALAVFGNAILSGTSRYLNFGDSAGEAGYGIRDNAGTMEFKNSADNWRSFLPATGVQSITFADGTTQTTAASGGGISAVTTVSGGSSAYCPSGYYRTGCSSSAVQNTGWGPVIQASAAIPSGSNACSCAGSYTLTCYAYCAK
jgi:hypothetical protein